MRIVSIFMITLLGLDLIFSCARADGWGDIFFPPDHQLFDNRP